MAIVDEKKKIFGEIAGLRALSEGFPKFKSSDSLPSISNDTNPMNFLIDLLRSLVGFESLKDVIINTLTHNLAKLEKDVKLNLKKELNRLVSCGINPSIPNSLVYSSNGIDLEIRKLDYLSILLTNPNSNSGKLLYGDVANGLNSSDFNTFLYNVLQDDGVEHSWGSSIQNNDIISLKFNSFGSINNILNVKASDYYSNNKKLVDLNNNYIDSIQLFDVSKILNNIFDNLFGVISLDVKKTKKEIQKEFEVNELINRFINSDDDQKFDDSFFVFSNKEINELEILTANRKNGVAIINGDKEINSTIPLNDLINFNDELNNSSSLIDKGNVINKNLNILGNSLSESVNDKDKYTVKSNFVDSILKQLLTSIANILISPKIVLILSINHLIVYGETFEDISDFMKKNRKFIKSIMNSVRDSIIEILLKEVSKEVSNLVTSNLVAIETEKSKMKKAQLSGLLGVDDEMLRIISGINN